MSNQPTELNLTFEELLAAASADSSSEEDLLADLDDLMVEMGAADLSQQQGEVEEHVEELLADLSLGANQLLGQGPQGVALHPVYPPDLGRHDDFSPQKVSPLIGKLNDPANCDQVEAGIVGLIVHLDVTGLGELSVDVASIKESFLAGTQPAQVKQLYRPILQGMIDGRPALVNLCTLVVNPNLAIPLPQASAVMCFHNAYPQFWTQLTRRIQGFQFNSGKADPYGGGLFKDNLICISNLPFTPPGAYVRLLVHEIGHAAFETVLLNKKTMPPALMKDTVASLREKPTGGTWNERDEECTTVKRYWKTMSQAAKIFYQSWRVLRANDGQYLLGTDMWQTRQSARISVEARRKYQADSFDEFCAESFMLFAMGDLHAYVANLLTDNAVGTDVKRAWANAWWILSKIAAPILAGHNY